jgi:hypothetical protein
MAAPQISGNPIDQDKTPGDGPGCEYVTFRGTIWLAVSLAVLALVLLGLLLLAWPRCKDVSAQQASAESGGSSSVAAATTTDPTAPAGTPAAGPAASGTTAGGTTSAGASTSGAATTAGATSGGTATGTAATGTAATTGAATARTGTTGGTGPSITAIAPSRGPVTGGNSVVLRGTNLSGVTQVSFGGVPAAIQQIGPTSITVKAPQHSAGQVDVTLAARTAGPPRYVFEAASTDEADESCKCGSELGLLRLVILAGALGGVLHSLRSLYWYAGNRKLIRSWVLKYFLVPLTGALLAVTFFIVVRAGLSPDTVSENCLVLVGIAVIVGLFSEEAVEKLKKIAAAVLTEKPQGADPAPPRPVEAPGGTAPIELALNPSRGPSAGGTKVEISGLGGADLAGPPKVLFGDTPAPEPEVVNGKSLRVVSPPGSGEVDVSVTLASGPRLVKSKGFVYDPPANSPAEGGTG